MNRAPNCVRATPDCAWPFFVCQVPGVPGADHSAPVDITRLTFIGQNH